MTSHQMGSVNRDQNYKREPERNSGAEECSGWNEKLTGGSAADLSRQEEGSANLQTGQSKLPRLRGRKKAKEGE